MLLRPADAFMPAAAAAGRRAVYEAALDWDGKSLEERRQKSKGGRKKRKAGRGVKFIQTISRGKYPLAEDQVYNKFVQWRKDGKKVKDGRKTGLEGRKEG